MSDELEKRYARVLRLYPAGYRHERGDELMATLLEAAGDGRKWPAARESVALTIGALREHAGGQRRSVKESWLAAARVAAVMVLVSASAGAVVRLAFEFATGAPATWWMVERYVPDLAALPFGVCAVITTLRGRYRVAAAATALAFLTAFVVTRATDEYAWGGQWQYPVAFALLVPLLVSSPPPVSGVLRYAAVFPLVLLVGNEVASNLLRDVTGIVNYALIAALCGAALLWVVVDERVAMAVGLLYLGQLVLQLAGITVSVARGDGAVLGVVDLALVIAVGATGPLVLLSAAALAARRHARL